MLDAVARLVDAITDLALVIGRGWFGFYFVVLVGAYVSLRVWRDRHRAKQWQAAIDAKDEEINRRVAAEKEYREILLKQFSVPEEVLNKDREDSRRVKEQEGE